MLTEKEMDGYRVVVRQEGNAFVVINTYDKGIVLPTPTPTVTPTLEPDQMPTPTPTLKPSAAPTREPRPTCTPKPTKKPRPTKDPSVLPQTGQLWWPVPALMSSGVLLVMLGLIRRRGDDDEE